MVLDAIWEQTRMTKGMLCIGCLENRISRKLHADDFFSCLLNHGGIFPQSERLHDRIFSTAY